MKDDIIIYQADEALTKLFTRQRILFWYDEKQELLEQFKRVH